MLIAGGVQSDSLAERVRTARRRHVTEDLLPEITVTPVEEIPKSRNGKTLLIRAPDTARWKTPSEGAVSRSGKYVLTRYGIP